MKQDIKSEIQSLAYSMWKSAGDEYGRAFDFWLMAEKMVMEVTAAMTQMTRSAVEAAVTQPPMMRAAYVEKVTALANTMWQNTGTQMGSALDFWLAAERHMRTLTEQTVRAAGASVGADEAVSRMFETFSPDTYLEEIRKIAYSIWETAGHQYGSALDIWLAAERQFLEVRIAMVPVPSPAAPKKWTAAAAPEKLMEPPRKAPPAAPSVVPTPGAAGPAAAPATSAPAKPKPRRAPAVPRVAPSPGTEKRGTSRGPSAKE